MKPARPPDYDRDAAIVQHRVFADPAIHRAELGTMFDRAWQFVAPANWLTRPGDFVVSRMAEEPILCWRAADGRLRLFVNRCARGDAPLTLAPRGRAETLACPCHGWRYSAGDGGERAPALEEIARVAIHRGLVFAHRDGAAPDFADWLGDFAWYLDLFVPPAGVEAYGGDALRWTVDANWKLPVLAGCGDPIAHPAARADEPDDDGAQISLAGGVATVRGRAATGAAASDDPRDDFEPLVAVIFPNLLLDRDRHTLDVVHPLGPERCEIHSYCLVESSASPEERESSRRRFQSLSGPSGSRAGDQAWLWESVTANARSGRHRARGLSLRMGLGRERRSNLPGSLSPLASEANQRAFFGWWQQQLATPARAVRRLMRIR